MKQLQFVSGIVHCIFKYKVLGLELSITHLLELHTYQILMNQSFLKNEVLVNNVLHFQA